MDLITNSISETIKTLSMQDAKWLFVGSFSFWLAAHFLVLPIFELVWPMIAKNSRMHINKLKILPPHRMSNFRRLLRSLVFCVVSCAFGFYLLFNYYHHYPNDLLLAWSDMHRVAFFVAIGHWTFCFLEDYWAGDAVHSFTKLDPEASRMFRKDLVRHHAITVFAYAWCLNTHYLSALCVFGMCFELPVFFISYREILFGYDDVFNTLDTLSFLHFKRLWMCVYTTWHLTRSIFCLHWPWSLIFWRKYLSTIPYYSFLVYHFLGIAFNYANFRILTTVLSNYALEDAKRFGVRVKKSSSSGEVGGYAVEIPGAGRSTSGDDHIEDDSGKVYSSVDVENQQLHKRTGGAASARFSADAGGAPSGGCPFKGSASSGGVSHGRKLIGPKELAEHNTADSCWLLIRGKVYDVTEFLSQHPGGAQILIRNAGKDASEEFTRANHSSNASHMMSKYVVAEMLPHGYDQVGITPEVAPMTPEERLEMRRKQGSSVSQFADTSEPFHLLNRYFSCYDPMIPSILLPILAWWWMRHYTTEITAVLLPRIRSALPGYTLPVGLTESTVWWLATVVAVRFTVLAAGLLLFCSNSLMQQTIIPNVIRFWIPASWTGPPSSWPSAVMVHSQLLVSGRVHAGAIGWLVSWIAMAYLLMHPLGAGTVRVAFLVGSLIEYLGEYVTYALSDAASAIGHGQLSYLQHFRPVFICKALMDSFDSMKYVGVWFLLIAISLDGYGVVTNGAFDWAASNSGSAASAAPAWLPAFVCNSFVSSWSPVYSVFVAWFAFGLGRVLYCKSVHVISDRLSSDSFGATTILMTLSAVYAIVLFLFSSGALVEVATVSATGTDATVAAAMRLGSLFPLVNAARDGGEMFWASLMYAVEALGTAVMATSFAVFVTMTRPAYANHVQLSGCPLFGWSSTANLGGGWWSFLWFMLAINCFGKDTSRRFQSTGTFGTGAPAYWYRIKELEDKFRYYVLFFIYTLIIIPIINLMSALAPYGNRFWAPPGMIVDIPNGEYGVAMMLNAKDQKEPTVFQCNIGYMNIEGPDLVGTVQQTQQMLQEIALDPEAGKKGFVSDMVVVFQLPAHAPARQLGYDFRELNFSAWENEAAAYNWYKNSAAHKRIVKDYYNAGLHSFGALLARLKPPPEAPLRWEVRCQACRKMVLGPTVHVCPYCNGPMQPLPYV